MKLTMTMLALLVFIGTVEALSTSTPPVSKQFIELTGQEYLPSSFVSAWPTWVLEPNGDLSKIPDDGGYVSPTSIDELYQPIDLKMPQVRLALGLHIRDGSIRHVLPAVDMTLDGQHRNRGLCSVPRAYRWEDFSVDSGVVPQHLTLATRKVVVEGEEEEAWVTLLEVVSIKDALSAAVRLLTEEPPEELGSGSNILNVIIADGKSVDCPKMGNELRVQLGNDEDEALGELQVQVLKTGAGSESEYMPAVYKPLFENEFFRRQSYIEFKKRLEKKNKKKNE